MVYATTRAPGDTRPGILIIGHIDTVHPVGTLGENPCRIEGDRLYGPGSYDMKAGIVLALAGLTGLAAPGATRLPIDFLMVPDEETGSHASREHIEHLAKQAKYGLVCEPARPNGGKCVTARKGTGMLRLGVKGRPAHAGMAHEKGRSAIREMAHQVLALENMTDYARGVTVSVGTIAGGTVTNTVPAQCRCVVDFRVPDMGAAEDVLRRMRQLCAVGPDVELDIDVELNRPPMVKTAESAALLELAQAMPARPLPARRRPHDRRRQRRQLHFRAGRAHPRRPGRRRRRRPHPARIHPDLDAGYARQVLAFVAAGFGVVRPVSDARRQSGFSGCLTPEGLFVQQRLQHPQPLFGAHGGGGGVFGDAGLGQAHFFDEARGFADAVLARAAAFAAPA